MVASDLPRVAVVIASAGRPDVLHHTILSILRQNHVPETIVVSVPSSEHIYTKTSEIARLQTVISPRGSTTQRNMGVAAVGDCAEVISFFDDDVVLASDYLEAIGEIFLENEEVVLVTGKVLADGVKTGGFSFAAGQEIVDQDLSVRRHQAHRSTLADASAYGCNMSVRRTIAQIVSFDTRLPLYGWLEDLDYSYQCEKHGRIVRCEQARMVHLGVRSGRTSERRYGYSQIMNSYYLYRKGSLKSLRQMLIKYWIKPFAMNLALSPFGGGDFSRRARLIGNLIAIGDVLRGSINPERIMEFE